MVGSGAGPARQVPGMSLRIASGFALPLEIAGEATAILATRGAGKSYASAVLAEELYAAAIQTLVLDPTGVYWGLRGSGEKAGLPIYVFGGPHGDLPLEPTSGNLFADLAVDEKQSFVLDLSGFDTKAEQTRFVTAFAERLYRRKAQNRTTLHLIVDEADEFAPQRPMRDEPRMLGAMEALVRRGRSRGLGVTLITQRSAALNKNVLDLIDTLIVMRITGPRDRKQVADWVTDKDLRDELGVLDSLPKLPTGTGWVWSPVRSILEKVEIRRIRTFDSYRTPKPGEARAEPKELAPIDLASLGEKIRATAEKAKAEDPRELRKQIASLKADLATRPTEEIVREITVEIPKPVFNGEVEQLDRIAVSLKDLVAGMAEQMDRLTSAALTVAETVAAAKGVTALAVATPTRAAPRVERASRPHRAESRPPAEPHQAQDGNGEAPTRPQQKVLDALAWLASIGLQGDRLRVGFLAGYSPNSGNFNNLLGQLKAAGLVDYPRPGAVALTEAGEIFAPAPQYAITTSELHARVLAKLRGPQRRVLEALLARYPTEATRDEIADEVGYSATSGNFNNILGSLRTLGVIDYPAPGYVRAGDLLFLE